MGISYYSDGTLPRQMPRAIRAMIGINAIFGALILGAWTYVSVWVSEPIAWATWFRVYRSGNPFDIFEYPFVFLWGLPFVAIAGAWIAYKAGKRGLAYASVSLPIFMHGTLMAWFHFAPPEWR